MNVESMIGKRPESLRTLHEVLTGYMHNKRRGTSSTKTRGLVSGGGRKPWKQKGTGNARSGSIRSPLWRGGGIIFGPLPRSYRVELSKEKRREALRSAFALKVNGKELSVLKSWSDEIVKTKQIAELKEKLKVTGRSLFVFDAVTENMARAFANIPKTECIDVGSLSALELMRAHQVWFTMPAMDLLSKRLGV